MDYNNILKNIKTPAFVFDISILLNRIEYLKNMLTNVQNIVYAVKANTFIIKEIDNVIDRYELCSPGEFDITNNLNIDRKKMVISGVYKDEETINRMLKNYDDIGKFTIESLEQWKLLEKCSKKYNRKINVLVRLTSSNQFGVSEEDFKYILKNYDKTLLNIDGIEYFSGTQKHSIKKIKKEIEYLKSFIDLIENDYSINIKEIEYGPGLPVFYFKDEEFDEDDFLREINEIFEVFKGKIISIELGRSIVASSGMYFTKVVDLKANKNGNVAIVDGGINQLVYYGQTMAMRIPHFEIIPKREDDVKTYTVFGSLCTVNDILVKGLELNELKLGDTFVFKNVGAYSVTEGIALFLSRDLPTVALIDKNEKIKIIREDIETSKLNFPNYE